MTLPALLKRIVLVLILFFIFATPAFAQTNPDLTANTNPDVPKNLHNWTQNVMLEVMSAMLCQLTGIDPVNPNQQCLGVDPKTGQIGFVESGGGAIGVMNNMIAMTYTSPLHTGDYFSYLAQNFGIAKPVYAQTTGTGFDGLKPLLKVWVAFRNIVYMLFIAVFILVGFGIMLRIHIDPRTVMTIANQLPKMIIAILLVTFSFAISGFLVDIMWASIYVTHGVIADAKVTDQSEKVIDLSGLNPTNMAGKSAFDAAGGIGNMHDIAFSLAVPIGSEFRRQLGIETGCKIGGTLPDAAKCLNNLFNPLNFTGLVVDSAGWIAGTTNGINLPSFIINLVSLSIGAAEFYKVMHIPGLTGAIPGVAEFLSISSNAAKIGTAVLTAEGAYVLSQLTLREVLPVLIPYIIIATALIWALFRIWLELIKAYISILIHTVLSPFWIIGGLFPGSSIGFGGWFREMLANLAAFPVTIGMFLLGKVFIEAFKGSLASGPFVPPLIGNFGNTNLFGALIGLGIVLMTPQVVNMMKDLIKAPPFKYGAGVGQAIGVGAGLTNLPGHAQTIGSTLFGLSHFPGLRGIPGLKNILPGGPADPRQR